MYQRIRDLREDADKTQQEIAEAVGMWLNTYVKPGYANVQGYNCPRCNRLLFEADVSLHGVIFIKCRRCRREVAIETVPTMQRIGYINTLRKGEQQ